MEAWKLGSWDGAGVIGALGKLSSAIFQIPCWIMARLLFLTLEELELFVNKVRRRIWVLGRRVSGECCETCREVADDMSGQ